FFFLFIKQNRIEAMFWSKKIFRFLIDFMQVRLCESVAQKQFKIAVAKFDICFRSPAVDMSTNGFEPVVTSVRLQQQWISNPGIEKQLIDGERYFSICKFCFIVDVCVYAIAALQAGAVCIYR